MRFLASLSLWATLAYLVMFLIHPFYEPMIGALAAQLAAPGFTIEWVDLELFYPYEIGIYVALCLAGQSASKARAMRALFVGIPILLALEVLTAATAIRVLLRGGNEAEVFAAGLVRFGGLVSAAVVWVALIGREWLPLGYPKEQLGNKGASAAHRSPPRVAMGGRRGRGTAS